MEHRSRIGFLALLACAGLIVGSAADADTLRVSCQALTPWNGGLPAKTSFSMFIDIDPVQKTVRFQPDVDKCCQLYGNTTDADPDRRTASFEVNRIAFGSSAPGRPPELYTFDMTSGTLTHDFGYSSGGGADRHILSRYQCIDLKLN